MSSQTNAGVRNALLAAIIGGAFALGGSALGYVQAREAQSVTRTAYGSFAKDFADVRSQYLAIGNAMNRDQRAATVKEQAALDSVYQHLVETEARVFVVAPDKVRDAAQDLDRALAEWRDALLAMNPANAATTDRNRKATDAASNRITSFYEVARNTLELSKLWMRDLKESA